jgi:hypothetical protein
LQLVKAKAMLKKTSNREVRFTGRSLGLLLAGATALCTRGKESSLSLEQNFVGLTAPGEIAMLL